MTDNERGHHAIWLREHADILDEHGYDHTDDSPGLGAMPDQMRMAADRIEELEAENKALEEQVDRFQTGWDLKPFDPLDEPMR